MLVNPGKLMLCPGDYDGFTARIALDAGFDSLGRGFGSSLSLTCTVQAHIQLKVAAMQIEEQAFIKRCGQLRNRNLVSLDDYLMQVRAAANTRMEPGRDIVMIARTDFLQALVLTRTYAASRQLTKLERVWHSSKEFRPRVVHQRGVTQGYWLAHQQCNGRAAGPHLRVPVPFPAQL
ncbi:Pyruvate/Phosphoenolpyruvate kinase-like domain-containing protein [Dactylonectria macrodidyma]|uniref:Pyruvate/Phosphoenolpyruvate kinase-like domain-containing protein n=1 Tax=Dactylonectria macrodidyma TaxID=307937 RepID=A0A9P9FM41_9HYPO|nr:Pyruvate/Phosphoenolpyruvate kinase-like domain-containing protein [Dactylonectria macrodidyma]